MSTLNNQISPEQKTPPSSEPNKLNTNSEPKEKIFDTQNTVGAKIEAEKTEMPIQSDEKNNFLNESIGGLQKKLRAHKTKPTKVPQVKDNVTIEIEKIMENTGVNEEAASMFG